MQRANQSQTSCLRNCPAVYFAIKNNNVEPKPTKKDKPKEVVFIHDKDKAKIREVKTGITDTAAGTIEVISGLKEGEEIVSGPFIAVSKKLKDGEVIMKKVEKKEDKDKKKE